jgi:hypothetical protein
MKKIKSKAAVALGQWKSDGGTLTETWKKKANDSTYLTDRFIS